MQQPKDSRSSFDAAQPAKYIDHTLLKPDSNRAAVEKLCEEAVTYGFYAVCVNGCWTRVCAAALKNTPVKLAVVIGFPLGAGASEAKAAEARLAIEHGAQELDMVLNIGALKDRDLETVGADVRAVKHAAAAAAEGRDAPILKVIIETALLSDEEKQLACRAAVDAGADFVKTSTGFAKGGATVEDVALMRREVGADIGVKASGGIRSTSDALAMIEAGATRLGTSSGVAIVSNTAADDHARY